MALWREVLPYTHTTTGSISACACSRQCTVVEYYSSVHIKCASILNHFNRVFITHGLKCGKELLIRRWSQNKMFADVSIGSSFLVVVFSLAAILIVNNMYVSMVVGSNAATQSDDTTSPVGRQPPDDLALSSRNGGSRKTSKISPVPINTDNIDTDEQAEQVVGTTKAVVVESNNWRCACEGGFLPAGLLKSFGGAEAVMRLGTGQCYHQQAA
jgi:hypothetical protein